MQGLDKTLLSEVLGVDIYGEYAVHTGYIEYDEEVYGYDYPAYREHTINIYELENKIKRWCVEHGYYLKSGFNTDIIDDDGDIDFEYEDVQMYETSVYQIVFDAKPVMKKVAIFGSNDSSDFLAWQWCYKQVKEK